MLRSCIAISLALSAPAVAQPADPGGEEAERDALCFVVSAVSARRMSRIENPTPQQQQATFYLHGVANYYGGRTSLHFNGDALRAQLRAALARGARMTDPNRFAMECGQQFVALMQVISNLDAD